MVKVERSYPSPPSLEVEKQKTNGRYSQKDVVNQLRNDFWDKCYLCEMKNLQDPEVEHLIPHKGIDLELKFDWNNLFLSCGHCNNVKNARKYDSGIINCCNVDPESVLTFRYENGNVIINTKEKTDIIVANTAQLLDEIYNKTNTGLRVIKCQVRVNQLSSEMNELYKMLFEYEKQPDDSLIRRKIGVMLSRKSAFAAFKRQYVRDNIRLYPNLKEFVE